MANYADRYIFAIAGSDLNVDTDDLDPSVDVYDIENDTWDSTLAVPSL